MKYTQFPDGKQASKISGGTRGGDNITFILFMSFIQVILHDQQPLDEVHASHTSSQASDAELIILEIIIREYKVRVPLILVKLYF